MCECWGNPLARAPGSPSFLVTKQTGPKLIAFWRSHCFRRSRCLSCLRYLISFPLACSRFSDSWGRSEKRKKAREKLAPQFPPVLFSCLRFLNSEEPTILEPGTGYTHPNRRLIQRSTSFNVHIFFNPTVYQKKKIVRARKKNLNSSTSFGQEVFTFCPGQQLAC